ncbi:FtsW/RodA/SpoVE family cell cycle protein [Ruminococcus gauvreauii]|uniref:FtsW/RodA/SpoVE family cell cycle protein n=1 Tax=Ruminococcus gauvreauii TaxID=438033 RepID=A0ABY5VH97_9FIRM|nr:FtsW/RodA/SpoVE family cell cycle protein [Ruminococcus gauvreauii]UWP59682.1 FtsW/RodA/SpoVE family cell cycle protein [Ruminococcus gauvreauii]
MINIIVELSKYLIIILMTLFTFQCFRIFKKKDEDDKKYVLRKQVILILFLNLVAFLVMYLQTMEIKMLIMYLQVAAYIVVLQVMYRIFYKKASMLVVNNMCMLLSCGFIMLSRLDFEKAEKQFFIVVAGTVISLLVPVIIRKVKLLKDLTWLYGILGIILLLAVLALSKVTGGANLALEIGGISFQFSELVKITFVFFVAGILRGDPNFKKVVTATVVAGIHVMILVLSTDLGSALVFFMTYVVMVYVATKKPLYALAGLAGGSLAAVAAYFLFGHVRQRVVAWKAPFSVYETNGYQIVQSLFAIGAGGWFGVGLFAGSPKSIPVVTQDFIFAAICEEMGAIFAICLLLVCMSCFLMILNISMRMSNKFYKLIALGLGTEYAFQVFLTVGGTTKFIPMTGITLPLVSYGGSSVICTIVMLAIIQGLYILREDEGAELEKQKQERNQRPGAQYEQKRRKGTEQTREKSLEEKIEEETEKSLRW